MLNLKLDLMYGQILERTFTPLDIKINGITEFSASDEAFALSAASGCILEVEQSNPSEKDGGVIRFIVGYRKIKEIEHDFIGGIQFLSLVQNAMLTGLAEKFDLSKCIVSFKRPGGGYFADDNPNIAGMELRAYCQKITNEKVQGV